MSSTPFNIEDYRRQRSILVELPSCGMTATVRPVTLVEVLNQIRLHPAAVKQAKEYKAQSDEGKAEPSPEEAMTAFADLYDLSCAIAIVACIDPPLTQKRDEQGKLHVYDLSDADLMAIIAPPLAELGLTREGLATIAPFREPGNAGAARSEVGQAAE